MKINRVDSLFIIIISGFVSLSAHTSENQDRQYPETDPEKILVYAEAPPDRTYVELGEVRGTARETDILTLEKSIKVTVNRMIRNAARQGADAIVLTNLNLENDVMPLLRGSHNGVAGLNAPSKFPGASTSVYSRSSTAEGKAEARAEAFSYNRDNYGRSERIESFDIKRNQGELSKALKGKQIIFTGRAIRFLGREAD